MRSPPPPIRRSARHRTAHLHDFNPTAALHACCGRLPALPVSYGRGRGEPEISGSERRAGPVHHHRARRRAVPLLRGPRPMKPIIALQAVVTADLSEVEPSDAELAAIDRE